MFEVRMMPGQVPYTQEELNKLYRLVGEAAGADVTEENESEVLRHYAQGEK